jgi:hypothetical protein
MESHQKVLITLSLLSSLTNHLKEIMKLKAPLKSGVFLYQKCNNQKTQVINNPYKNSDKKL